MWTVFVPFVSFIPLCLSQVASDARLPPTIVQGPVRENFYRSEYSFQLVCKASGIPAVTYQWKKNGDELNMNAHNVRHNDLEGTITISPATSLDSGFYQCVAKNQYGTAISNASYQQMSVLDSKASSDIFRKQVTEGEAFFIQAQPIKSVPKPKLSWEMAKDAIDQNPTLITLSERMQIADDGNLYFAYAKYEDNLDGKIYKCTAFNEIMDLSAGGSYTSVTVNRAPSGPPPLAPALGFASANPTVAVEGTDASLRCFFSGNPEPTLDWTGPRNTLPQGRIGFDQYNSKLTIRQVQPSDEGEYICTGRNIQGTKQQTIRMVVEALPRFQTPSDRPHDVNATAGESITFRCVTYAKPDASVVWLRNGQPIDLNNLPKRYAISSDRKSLTIENLCRDCPDRPESSQSDLGIVQCNASNSHGYAFAAGYVNVLAKTTAVISGEKEVEVEMDKERVVEFGCTVTSDPLTPVQPKWYKELPQGRQLVYPDPPVVDIKDGVLKIHVIPNTTQGWTNYEGTYKCIANNTYSEGIDTAVLKIKGYVPPAPRVAGFETYWWILLLLLLILLLILIIIICCCCIRRNRGDNYDVDEKERKNGNDPEKELKNHGFQDYQRPEGQTLRGSRGSLGSAGKIPSDEDASLLEYGDDPGKFTEDGSFVGAYASNTTERGRGRNQ